MKMKTMKTAVAALAGGVWAAAASAVPTVTVDSFVQTPSRLVKVGFTLSEAAIVTFDVQTNGVSVGGANLQTVEGSVNAKLEAGSYALRWWPAEESWDRPADATSAWSAPRLDNVQAVFHVWKDSQPPSYLVIDLVTKAVSYYDDAGAIPGGVTADRYKTDSLVLRLCPRTDSYMMGTANPWGTDHWIIGTRRPYHQVSFTNDFYIGVYEFTQGQYKNAIGSSPSCRWGSGDGRFPMDGANSALSHNKLRGSDTWPVGGHEAVTDDSILGKMRTKYGFAFDLPTEAQWEYASRGGREGCTLYNVDGFIYYNDAEHGYTATTNLYEIAVFSENAGESVGPSVVGTKKPNDWGIYDMLGNLCEWTLDYGPETNDFYEQCTNDVSLAVNPVGPTTGNGRIVRGGSYRQGTYNTTCCARMSAGGGWSGEWFGFRVAVEVPRTDED